MEERQKARDTESVIQSEKKNRRAGGENTERRGDTKNIRNDDEKMARTAT